MTYEEERCSDITEHFHHSLTNVPKNVLEINKHFLSMALAMRNILPSTDPETLVCLRKLLEAKDAALRAAREKKRT